MVIDNAAAFWLMLVVGYFVPSFVAYQRNHRNAGPIFLTTLFFGWTGIGWIVALIWAFSDNTRELKAG
jgi:hypothetical protein